MAKLSEEQVEVGVVPGAPGILTSGKERKQYMNDVLINLLPTRSEEREVLVVGSIPVAILPSCQDVKTIEL